MIADMLRGKQMDNFPYAIRKGVVIHRKIDRFTDEHPIVRHTKKIFNYSARRYDGIFLDIAYDYFLANDTSRTPENGWMNFSQWCYSEVDKRISLLPERFIKMFEVMKQDNWLYNYKNEWMIKRSFSWISKRAIYLPNNANIFADFTNGLQNIQNSYNEFFPELEEFVKEELRIISEVENDHRYY
nr:ACP phosphodiesterase [Dysgonomonas sp. 216]